MVKVYQVSASKVKKKQTQQKSREPGQAGNLTRNEAHPRSGNLSSRALAVQIVQDCVESKLSLSSLLPLYLEQIKTESRPFVQEISFGVLRWYHRLHPLLLRMLSKPLKGKKKKVHYILLVGLYQLNYLDKADYAVVAETVNVCDEHKQSWAKGLVNAILRRFLREKKALLAELDQSYASRFSYPEWLISAIKNSWKKTDRSIESILDAGNQRPPMTLRVNQQFDRNDYLQKMQQSNIAIADSRAFTVVLDKPVAVEKLPLFSKGAVSVQDGAPQLAAELLSPQPGDKILDACAAPGGKTMHLFEQQPLLESVTALDVSSERLKRVQENSLRMNIPPEKLILMTADAGTEDWWNGQLFDRILLDAPCSATGVIRRHPDIKILRRSDDIIALAQLQKKILKNLWTMLKPGGFLLYATCSILREENDQQVLSFIKHLMQEDKATEVLIEAQWGRAMPAGRQILPGEQNMDGFYYALLRKNTRDGVNNE